VAADPLAQRGRQPPVPVLQQLVKRGAVLAPRAADDEHRDRRRKLVARSGEEGVGVISRDPEHHGYLGDLEAVPELVDHVPFAIVEPGDRGADQRPRLRALRLAADVDALIGLLWEIVQGRHVLPGLEPVQALVSRHGEEPGLEPFRVTQPVQLRGGDDKCVLHRIGGVFRLPQQ
jgi:hypothetical protein